MNIPSKYKTLFVATVFLLLLSGGIPPFQQQQASANTPTLISTNKPATAKSWQAGRLPSLAVDGNTSNSNYWAGSMGPNNDTWWQVDLQGSYNVSQVKLFNYVDGRYYHYYIRGSLDGQNWFPLAIKSNNNPATASGDTYNVNATARYIRVNVTKNSANTIAHINEVQVYGYAVNTSSLPNITTTSFATDKGSYLTGQNVNLSYSLHNQSSGNVQLASVKAHIFGLTKSDRLFSKTLATNVQINAGQNYGQSNQLIWTIPSGTPSGAYGVYLDYDLGNGIVISRFEHFFRVVSSSQRTVYNIDKFNYNGLDVYALDGGMSAESAVQKSAEMLSAGTSHSWYLNGEGGPNPVYSTPSFLENSVEQTVSFYNNQFGATTPFDTVIISTGNASVPYLSHYTKAPVLPIQYLVGIDTIKELQEIMEYSNANGLPSFGTAGYARSMPMIGVAWIKLLGLPQAYIDFINDHQVKNVILMGRMGTSGESTAKKVLFPGTSSTGTTAGDIFAMYKQDANADDIAWMDRVFRDINEMPLESGYRNVVDWESGVLQQQWDQIIADLNNETSVAAIDVISSESSTDLYDFATFAALEYFKKNETLLSSGGAPVRGVAINPYLIAHPFYETKIHYVPLLYYQGKPVNETIDIRLNETVRDAIEAYYPSIVFENLKFWIDGSKNFGGYQATEITNRLQHFGLNSIEYNNYTSDEEWVPSNGMNAPVEQIAQRLTTYSTVTELKTLNNALVPLTLADLESIPSKFPGISVVRQ